MMACDVCDMMKDPDVLKVYEDDKIIAMLLNAPASPAHCIVAPKEHYPIMEKVPDFIISRIFVVANKISVALFESLNMAGTNLLVSNGIPAGQDIPHFFVNIVPRSENDSLNLNWQPQQASQDDLATVILQLQEHTANIGGFESEQPRAGPSQSETKTIEQKEGEDDYLMKSLDRIP
jgi:histidine triad (HIT) family protein